MWHWIGFGIAALGIILWSVTDIIAFALMMVGVILFASSSDSKVFVDYALANSKDVIGRKRSYVDFIPLSIASYLLTLGMVEVRIPYKQEYYKYTDEEKMVKITRAEYMTIRNEQRRIYSTQVLSAQFMKDTYNPAGFGLKRKKYRYIFMIGLAVVCITGFFGSTGDIIVAAILEAMIIPAIVLWKPEYEDAKILKEAYDRAIASEKQR